jgi:endo-1,4-beta-xylanase
MKRRRGVSAGHLLLVAAIAIVVSSCASAPGERGSTDDLIVYQEDFERSAGGWHARGPESVSISTDQAHSGSQSLLVTGRTASWNGPIKDVTTVLRAGQSYEMGAWAMFPEGPDTQSINISMQRQVDGSGEEYLNIGGGLLPRGDWVYIQVTFTVPRSDYVVPVSLYFETPYKQDADVVEDDLIDFYIDDVTISRLPPPPAPQAELDIPAFHTFFPDLQIGAAITSGYLRAGNVHYDLLRHFSSFVYTDEMKMDAMQPAEGRFNFTAGDNLVRFAESHGVTVRGHTLLWHNQAPPWFFRDGAGEAGRDVLLERIRTHIDTIVSHYRGQVDYWDVVNEPLDDSGNLRNSEYLQIVGSDEYIRMAFETAHAADPDALLFINDYNICYAGPKQDAMYELVRGMLADGIPIDGIGMQGHMSIGHPPVYEIENAIQRFASLGVNVHVTEMDMSIYQSNNDPQRIPDTETLLNQAIRYRALFDMFREQSEVGNLQLVTLWGIADDDTWLDSFPVPGRENYPLLFGKDVRAKPAYWAIVDPSRLPIAIRTMHAIRTEEPVTAEDEAWEFVTPKDIIDREGNGYGSFRAMWTEENLYILATIADATVDETDGIQFFVEPSNLREEALPAEAWSDSSARSAALTDDGEAYTILQVISFGDRPGVRERRIAFDLRVVDGSEVHSWNDLTDSQETASTNYGTIALTELPPMTTAAYGTVVIDGEIDPIWEEVTPVLMEVESMGVTADGSNFRVLWDEDYIYVLFEVVDPLLNNDAANPWEQDSIEVFLDQNNAKTSVYEPDDAQYRVSYVNMQTFNGGDEELFQSAAWEIPGGYMVEVAVPLTAIDPAPGTIVGFDVQVNEADAYGLRAGFRNWVSDTNLGYQNPSVLGALMLR